MLHAAELGEVDRGVRAYLAGVGARARHVVARLAVARHLAVVVRDLPVGGAHLVVAVTVVDVAEPANLLGERAQHRRRGVGVPAVRHPVGHRILGQGDVAAVHHHAVAEVLQQVAAHGLHLLEGVHGGGGHARQDRVHPVALGLVAVGHVDLERGDDRAVLLETEGLRAGAFKREVAHVAALDLAPAVRDGVAAFDVGIGGRDGGDRLLLARRVQHVEADPRQRVARLGEDDGRVPRVDGHAVTRAVHVELGGVLRRVGRRHLAR